MSPMNLEEETGFFSLAQQMPGWRPPAGDGFWSDPLADKMQLCPSLYPVLQDQSAALYHHAVLSTA